jgi:Short C-terminal domain
MINADSGFGGFGAFGDAFAVVAVLMLLMFLSALFRANRRIRMSRKVLRAGGVDPRTLGAQIAVNLAHGTALPSGMTIEQHLTELKSLHERGTISDEEYAAARAKAIGT